MDPGNYPTQCESFIAFSLEQPQYKRESYPVYGTKVIPQLLSLFPFTPASQKRDSVTSFVWHEGQQMNEENSGKDMVNRSQSERRSQKVRVGRARCLMLSTFRASKYGRPEETAVPPRVKKPRRSSSRASVQNATPLTQSLTPSQNTTSTVQTLGGQAELENRSSNQGRRHGPRPKSSPFRGVTHYKRTGRWEAHIWKKGKQIYLGASSTAIQAARAYDRAAIHFRHRGAALNFYLKDYAGELRLLMELSDTQLVKMLRKQSAGGGALYPEYPAVPELQLGHSPSEIRVPITDEQNHGERPSSSVVETIPHLAQVDPSNTNKALRSCSSSIGTMIQSHAPEGAQSTLHAPKARHVSEWRGQYLQVIHNILI